MRLSVSRIIPARAGFTNISELLGTLTRDHPRSRGVYLAESAGARVAEGSSPLARGLLHQADVLVQGRGIIPARAGFTIIIIIIYSSVMDHPRSRGVYWLRRSPTPALRGSSPLARGLHLREAQRTHLGNGSSPLARGLRRQGRRPGRARRIIPARAGFTTSARPPPRRPRDHPRSRGVYRARSMTWPVGVGSSPLARGLRSRGRR